MLFASLGVARATFSRVRPHGPHETRMGTQLGPSWGKFRQDPVDGFLRAAPIGHDRDDSGRAVGKLGTHPST